MSGGAESVRPHPGTAAPHQHSSWWPQSTGMPLHPGRGNPVQLRCAAAGSPGLPQQSDTAGCCAAQPAQYCAHCLPTAAQYTCAQLIILSEASLPSPEGDSSTPKYVANRQEALQALRVLSRRLQHIWLASLRIGSRKGLVKRAWTVSLQRLGSLIGPPRCSAQRCALPRRRSCPAARAAGPARGGVPAQRCPARPGWAPRPGPGRAWPAPAAATPRPPASLKPAVMQAA